MSGSARPRGFEPLTYGSGGDRSPLATSRSGSQAGGIVRNPPSIRVQASQPFAASSSPFAAPVLQGRPTLTVVPALEQRLLTVREVAAQLGVCTATIYTLCAAGKLEHVRVGNAIRVAPRALGAFIARRGG
ncbi:MAG: helix-turn-helix domain-containing protein [Polyangiaceae bacterium]|nr:helix-turn-helix domain-containing protein [Polyangiaceae bacterium]